MAHEIVKYDNSLNQIQINTLSPLEQDLLMTIACKIDSKGTEMVHIRKDEIKSMTSLAHYTDEQLRESLIEMSRKLAQLIVPTQIEKVIRVQGVFDHFDIPASGTVTLDVSIRKEYSYLFNAIKNYTRFELQEFGSLRSVRSKTLYRLCKQWRSKGQLIMSVEQVTEQFSCGTYRSKDIWTKIIEPSTKECKKYIPDLVCIRDRDLHAAGRPVIRYRWIFTPEKRGEIANTGKHIQEEQIEFNSSEDFKAYTDSIRQQAPAKKAVKKNSFNDFQQNDYDFAEIEKAITG